MELDLTLVIAVVAAVLAGIGIYLSAGRKPVPWAALLLAFLHILPALR